jgi:hypothetical protein
MGQSKRLWTPGLALAVILLSSDARAQNAYVTSSNNQILRVDSFSGGGSVSQAAYIGGAQFHGLAVRDDGALIVADSAQGGSIWVLHGSQTPIGFPQAEGVGLDPNGNIFAVNGNSGGPDRVVRIPLGCASSSCIEEIDDDVVVGGLPTQFLADVKSVNFTLGSLSAGDLVVLVGNPAMALRYSAPTDWASCEGTCEPSSVLLPTSAFGGRQPTGLAFAPSGELLISTWQGEILRFKPDGSANGTFATLPGNGKKIAVGTQDGVNRLFAGVQGGGVARYDITASGAGINVVHATNGIASPDGVGIATGNAAPTPVGAPSVQLQNLDACFQKVDTAGLTDADCVSFIDPRDGNLVDLDLDDPALPQAVRDLAGQRGFPNGFPNTIPWYVQPFDDVNGDPTFRLCLADTTAVRRGLVKIHSNERDWLGLEPDCGSVGPRLFYSEEPPETELQEGRVFVNITVFCNRDEGDSARFGSLFLPSVRDIRPLDGPGNVSTSAICAIGGVDCSGGVLECQLGNLKAVLECSTSACVSGLSKSLKNSLKKTLNRAIQKHNAGGYCGAKSELDSFVAAIVGNSSASLSDCGAELRARADAAIFSLSQAGDPSCPIAKPPCP